MVLKLTVPLVDYDAHNHNWNKITVMLNCLLAPLFIVFATKMYRHALFQVLPMWAVALIIGVVATAIVAVGTKLHEKPKFHWLFAYFGFFVSVIWIYTIANEIVNLLTVNHRHKSFKFKLIIFVLNSIVCFFFLISIKGIRCYSEY